MVMLTEREGKLINLQDKSETLQGTSSEFTRKAKHLRWEMKWQQYRMLVFITILAVWAACFYPMRHHVTEYIAISCGASALLYLIQRYVSKRWRVELESGDSRNLLGSTDV